MDFDAAHTPTEYTGSDPHLRLGSYRVTDLSAALGSVTWLVLTVAAIGGAVDLTVVELYVCLALLTFVPLGLGLAVTPRRSGGTPLPYKIAVYGQFPGGVAAAGALALPVGSPESVVFGLPWLGVTGAIAIFGLWRLLSRGIRPLPEFAIDAALFYVPVGAVALLLHRAGISLRFESIIILLTAIHYHYAGFVLPLVAGLAGRIIAADDGQFGTDIAGWVAATTTIVIVMNLALIAVGITFSPLVEVIAVALFTVAVAGFALLVLFRVVPAVPRLPATLLTVASVAIVATMALALAYGYSAFPLTGELISIGEMVRWHGSLNAFGFALSALLAFRLVEE